MALLSFDEIRRKWAERLRKLGMGKSSIRQISAVLAAIEARGKNIDEMSPEDVLRAGLDAGYEFGLAARAANAIARLREGRPKRVWII